MKGYKGFEKGLICRGKQYAENTVFEEENAEICKSGMHFCELPHVVFEHYSPGENHEFADVEALDDVQSDEGGRKFCTKKLKIGAKINVFDVCKVSVSAFFEKFEFGKKISETKNSPDNNAGNYGAANAGNCGAAIVRKEGKASVGNNGVAIAFGSGSKAKGKKGACLVFIETDENGNIINKRAVVVDGVKLQEDIFYTLKNNRLEKCNDNDKEGTT